MSLKEVLDKLRRVKSASQLIADIENMHDINLCDNEGRNVLHHFIEHIKKSRIADEEDLTNLVTTIRQLISLISEETINATDIYGETPLNLASRCGYEEISWALLDRAMPDYIEKSFKPVIMYNNTFNSYTSYNYSSSTEHIKIIGEKEKDILDNFEPF